MAIGQLDKVSSKAETAKKAVNLSLGIISFLAYLPIIFVAGVAALFADCPSCNAKIPFCIMLLALIGAICCKILLFFRKGPYRIDTLFLLPIFTIEVITILPFTNSNFEMERSIIPSLYSAAIALLLEISFLIYMCMKFFTKKNKQSGISHSVDMSHPIKSSNTIFSLLGAIISGDADLVRAALQEHPDYINTAYAQNGNTPLHVAALNGQTEIVKLLLEQPGLDTTLKNNEGKTARDLAQEKNFTEIVNLLRN